MKSLVFMGIMLLSSIMMGNGLPLASKNVVLLVIDDLNDWIEPMSNSHPQTKTPVMQNLTKRNATVFQNAHCNAVVCGPSRTSFLTGLHPARLNFYSNQRDKTRRFFAEHPDLETLPKYFKANGYGTYASGKLFHHQSTTKDQFDSFYELPNQNKDGLEEITKVIKVGKPSSPRYAGSAYRSELHDVKMTDWAVNLIQTQLASSEQPFFLSLGYITAHLPHVAPLSNIRKLPKTRDIILPNRIGNNSWNGIEDLDDLPPEALEVISRQLQAIFGLGSEATADELEQAWRVWVRHYLACINTVDELVGEVINALESAGLLDETIIALMSDNGYHMGEKNRLTKNTLWTRSTLVPIIVSLPPSLRDQPRDEPRNIKRPVELVDLFPTLVELAGIPAVEEGKLDGRSLASLISDQIQGTFEKPVVSSRSDTQHTIRRENGYKYIEYTNGDQELYNTKKDWDEFFNLAEVEEEKKKLKAGKRKLKKALEDLRGRSKYWIPDV